MVETRILPLELQDVVVRYRGKRLLGPVSTTVEPGGLTIVLGPNGAGKTTLLRAMHGLARLSDGQLTWAVPEVDARAHQRFVFQTPVMMRRSVLDSIAYPLRLRGVAKDQARNEATLWAERFGLGEALARSALVLSGGERQKLALARALITRPEVLFLDEPCANLDGRSIREIEQALRDAQAQGTRILMSTHDLAQARRLAQDVLFLYRGRLVESASCDAFFNAPQSPEAQVFVKGDILE